MASLAAYKLEACAGEMEEIIEVAYDFALDGGAIGALDIFKAKEGMVVTKAYAVVVTGATSSGAATISVGKSGATAALIAVTALTAIDGAGECVAGVANLAYPLSTDDVVIMTIADFALTAGKIKFRFHVASK